MRPRLVCPLAHRDTPRGCPIDKFKYDGELFLLTAPEGEARAREILREIPEVEGPVVHGLPTLEIGSVV